MLVGVLAMSSASLFIRLAQAEGVSSIVIAAYRLAVATLVLTVPAMRRRVWVEYAKLDKRAVGLLLLSGILLGLHFATWVSSLALTSVISSVVLVTTTPLWIALASPLLLGERTAPLTWAGIAAAITGGIIVGLADRSGMAGGSLWGNGLALAGAILAAGYLMIGRNVRHRLDLLAYLWVVYGTAAILLLGWALFAGMPLWGYTPVAVVLMIALGLIPQLIGHTAANYVVRHLSASFVAVATLGEPVGSAVLAMIFLQEWPSALQLAGSALILGGIGMASLGERKGQAGPAAPPDGAEQPMETLRESETPHV
ncbi:MAG: DMT family transporter [Anaerolineae bacterium]